MAKTCRTCTWGSRNLRLFCLAPNGQCYVGPDFSCDSWEESRETPLLVDELAEALHRLEAVHDSSVYRPHSKWDEAVQQAREALARYQKEVGDA